MLNPWTQGRVPSVPISPPLGAWQNRRTLQSPAYVPQQWARLGLEGAHLFFYQFPELTLLANQTDLTAITISEDFWAFTMLGHATQTLDGGSGSFRALVYEDTQAFKWSKYALNQPNFCSPAKEPGLMRVPHFIKSGTPMNIRIQNLAAATNVVSVCLFGYSAWWRT